ncbi:hypothetical protein BDV96DRAFT_563769 [Lophiotrema nucula]|uniref:EF-hand domain-containing protein n=1 Tax=Lophiotrema nucula TaxID=690887 RepID=A0A6A5ZQS0_9PLEO|nr:hypothetical protein BDV96DRAFT_563769 [Lophiotrema nucula]
MRHLLLWMQYRFVLTIFIVRPNGCSACTQTCPEKCLALCQQECPPVPSDPSLWQWYDQQCYVHCGKVCLPPQDTAENGTTKRSLVRSVFEERERDDNLFREIDRENLGFFDYAQFLNYRGWARTSFLRSHFDR